MAGAPWASPVPKVTNAVRTGVPETHVHAVSDLRPLFVDPHMRKILIIGAGRSSASLIHYLMANADSQRWQITVADQFQEQAMALLQGAGPVAQAVALNATDADARYRIIAAHDLVISMLPAFMHMDVLRDCLKAGKHVITPSYVPEALWEMHEDFRKAGLVVLNEMGLDPGIDHMSAMRILDRIRAQGATVDAFESYTGGLVAPESDSNPWGYKFSWNPRNVVLAGQGGAARFIEDGITKYIPYHQLFRRSTSVHVPGLGAFDGYANRDSLKYRSAYGLAGIPTLVRGTLRKAGYCAAWNALVQLGCTDDSYTLELPAAATWCDFVRAFLPPAQGDVRSDVATYLGLPQNAAEMDRLEWLGLFADKPITVTGLSPAATLQTLLEERWKLGPEDKDLVVMWHRFRYHLNGIPRELVATLSVTGEDRTHTAMARTVGLPIAMACKLVLNGDLRETGVLLPLKPSIYDPILDELETHGVVFHETEHPFNVRQ